MGGSDHDRAPSDCPFEIEHDNRMSEERDPRYPIGRAVRHKKLTQEQRRVEIDRIKVLPSRLRLAVSEVGPEKLEGQYRPGSWTGVQIVHHIADSHVNAWVRFKLALTEEDPVIRPYDENAWARLPDHARPLDESLELIDALHRRWVSLLEDLTEDDWQRRLNHPEAGQFTLDELLSEYAWHGDHHVAHIRLLR